jgi:hypothetical protein
MQLQSTTTVSMPAEKYNVDLAPECPRETNSSASLDQIETVVIAIYPNPVSDMLTVQYSAIENGTIKFTLFNELGALVMQTDDAFKQGIAGIKHLDFSSFPSGTYFLHLTDQKGNSSKTTIIKK